MQSIQYSTIYELVISLRQIQRINYCIRNLICRKPRGKQRRKHSKVGKPSIDGCDHGQFAIPIPSAVSITERDFILALHGVL